MDTPSHRAPAPQPTPAIKHVMRGGEVVPADAETPVPEAPRAVRRKPEALPAPVAAEKGE